MNRFCDAPSSGGGLPGLKAACPSIVSLCVVAPLLIYSAHVGATAHTSNTWSRVFEIGVASALVGSFAVETYENVCRDGQRVCGGMQRNVRTASERVSATLYVVIAASLLCSIAVAGAETPTALYIVLYIVAVCYATFHFAKLIRHLRGERPNEWMCFPTHPLRRFTRVTTRNTQLPALALPPCVS